MTAIKLCTKLKEAFVDYNFVPVFWMEADDHDFEEVNAVNIFNNEMTIKSISYINEIDDNFESGSVGNVIFDSRIETLIEKLKQELRDSDFNNELIESIGKFYKNGKSFKESFKELLMYFFDELGLVIFDPQDVEYKKLLIPIFEDELINYDNHTKLVLKRSAQLEENYHAQVKVKPINLFFSENNRRYLIEPDDVGYRLKNKRKKFSKEEILEQLHSNPELFSPNVLLRPICQDYFFPTAFYIGGPSEICYFGQLIPYYSIFNIPQPILYPRASITIIENNIKNLIDKYKLDFLSVVRLGDELIQKVLNENSDLNTENLFTSYSNKIKDIFNELESELLKIDKTLSDPINKTKERTISGFEFLKARVEKAQLQKNEVLHRQLTKILNSVMPDSNYQERVINFSYFYNKYGKDFFSLLFDEISISKFEHQIIEINSN